MGVRWLQPIILIFCLTVAMPAAHAAPADGRWTTDLQSVEGRLQLLQSITDRHPHFPSSNLQFRGNHFEVLAPVPDLVQKLGSNASSLAITPGARFGIEYTSSVNTRYDTARLEGLRKGLIDDLRGLEIRELKGLVDDLENLRQAVKTRAPERFEKLFKEQSGRLLRLAPFLYDSQARPLQPRLTEAVRGELEGRILSESPGALANSYLDLFKHDQKQVVLELAKARGHGYVPGLLQTVENQFVDKQVHTAVQLIGSDSKAVAKRAISLEEIPAAVAHFRGMAGGDCSMLSVPYYPLVKGTKTYWIRKSLNFGAQPDGYVFVVPTMVDGKRVPYVVTVNGVTLSSEDARKIVQLVAEEWKSEKVVLANHKFVVNTPEIRKGLALPDASPLTVELPPGWQQIEEFQDNERKAKRSAYDNYYSKENLGPARIVRVPEEDTTVLRRVRQQAVPGYLRSPDLASKPLLSRALLGAQAHPGETPAPPEVLRTLRIEETHLALGRTLRNASQSSPLTAAQFEDARRGLGLKLADLLMLDPLTSTHSLAQIFSEKPELATDQEWRSLFRKADAELERQVRQVFQLNDIDRHSQRLRSAFAAKASIPYQFVPGAMDSSLALLGRQEMRDLAQKAGARMRPETGPEAERHFFSLLETLSESGTSDDFLLGQVRRPGLHETLRRFPAFRQRYLDAMTRKGAIMHFPWDLSDPGQTQTLRKLLEERNMLAIKPRQIPYGLNWIDQLFGSQPAQFVKVLPEYVSILNTPEAFIQLASGKANFGGANAKFLTDLLERIILGEKPLPWEAKVFGHLLEADEALRKTILRNTSKISPNLATYLVEASEHEPRILRIAAKAAVDASESVNDPFAVALATNARFRERVLGLLVTESAEVVDALKLFRWDFGNAADVAALRKMVAADPSVSSENRALVLALANLETGNPRLFSRLFPALAAERDLVPVPKAYYERASRESPTSYWTILGEDATVYRKLMARGYQALDAREKAIIAAHFDVPLRADSRRQRMYYEFMLQHSPETAELAKRRLTRLRRTDQPGLLARIATDAEYSPNAKVAQELLERKTTCVHSLVWKVLNLSKAGP